MTAMLDLGKTESKWSAGVLTIYMENPEIPVRKSNGVLLKLWASGQSDAFLLLLLGFTADVHTFYMLSIFC